MTVPIFDSLTHPCLSSVWDYECVEIPASFENLILQMKQNNYKGGLAVGLMGIGNYSEKEFIKRVREYEEFLFPISPISLDEFTCVKEIVKKVEGLVELGYIGVKLHPRIANFDLTHKFLADTIKICNDHMLIPLLCTYYYSSNPHVQKNNSGYLIELLLKLDKEKIILMHSGGIKLLETIEIARAFKWILLDLSFTILKYKGSSIESDILYAMNSFDRRICIGSDHPSYTPLQLRKEFDSLCKHISEEKAINIGYSNICSYLGIAL